MHNVMHWQQCVTIAVGTIGILSSLMQAVGATLSTQLLSGLWGAIEIAAVQWVLYSGGWYGY